MTPKILLSTSRDDPAPYLEAVSAAGGEPVAAYCPTYQESFDALILCGGSDVDPKFYGEPMAGSVKIDRQRDEAEFALIRSFLSAGKPIFGICRGCQILNVYFGGTLHQHLASTPTHASDIYGQYLGHEVVAEPGSLLARLYGEHFSINSHHHQAIKALAPCLRVTMRCPGDGVVEAVEHETLPVSAVQWHPEKMCLRFARPDTVDGLPLLRHFISSVHH